MEILRGEKDTEAYKSYLERVKEINAGKEVDWQFTTDDARIKLKHLYPIVTF